MAVYISRELMADLAFYIDGQYTLIECKTINRVLHRQGEKVLVLPHHGLGKTHSLQELLKTWREKLDVLAFGKTVTLQSLLKDVRAILLALAKNGIVKTDAARYYLNLVVLRPLLHMRALLRQKLASVAPAVRLTLRNRPRQIFASHPPVAPPDQA